MSYGFQKWGLSSWGIGNFTIENQTPANATTGVNRLPVISFDLVSKDSDVIQSSINVLINNVAAITNGIHTNYCTSTINMSDPRNVHVIIHTLNDFSPLSNVLINVQAANDRNEFITSGGDWYFTVDNTVYNFKCHIPRKFERVLQSESTALLLSPNNAGAILSLLPPNLTGEIV